MKLRSFFPGITWFLISVVLLALPGNDLPHSAFFNIPFFDKYVHFTMFFMLTALFCYPFFLWPAANSDVKRWFIKIAVYVVVYGIAMEFVQKYWVIGRSFDLADILFDALGSLAGLIAVNYYYKKIGPNRNRGRNQN